MNNRVDNHNLDYKFDTLIRMLMVLCVIIIGAVAFHIESLVSLSFAAAFVILLIISIRIIFAMVFQVSIAVDFFIMLGMFLFSFVFVVISGNGLMSFNYMRKFYMFASTVLFIFIGGIVNVKESTKKIIFGTGLILASFYIFLYLIGNVEYYGFDRYITFGHTNPNLTAMWLLAIFLLLMLGRIYFQNKFLKFIITVEIFAVGYFIYLTQARTCVLVALTFPLTYMIIKFSRCFLKLKRQRKLIIAIILFVPLIISTTYLSMIDLGVINENSEMVMSGEGKTMTSRDTVWRMAIEAIGKSPITGSYYELGGKEGSFQMHNTALDVCAAYGIPVYILFILLLTRIFSRTLDKCNNKFEIMLISATLTMLNTGIGEAGILGGSVGMYILACSFLLLINKKHESE